MSNQFLKAIDRAANLVGSYGHYRTIHERVDLGSIAIHHCNIINDSMLDFIVYVYQRTESGTWINIKSSGQVPKGVWTPMGSNSGLTRWERDSLRKYLLSLSTGRPPYPLMRYDTLERRWYIDILRYSDMEDAIGWWKACHVTIDIWLKFSREE